MTKIELSQKGFQINGTTIEFPINLTILKQALGNYSNHTEKGYIWDNLGIEAVSVENDKIAYISVGIENSILNSAKSLFTGEFLFEGQELFQYYKNNKNNLVKLFKGDTDRAFVSNGISVWFYKNNDKIISLIIKAYKEKKEKKISLPLDPEFKSFKLLWQKWISEINKIVSANSEYYNLTDGISKKDIKQYSTLENDLKIPPELINFYKVQNVESNYMAVTFMLYVNWPYELIPFEDIAEEWNPIQDLQLDEDELLEQEIDSEKIKTNNYANPKWIPFARERNYGDYLLYDTDPGPKGKFGQIIELQNESWERNIVADSLEELIQNEINNLKAGKTEHFSFIIEKEN